MLLQMGCAQSNYAYVLELLDHYPDYGVSAERLAENLTTVRLLSPESKQLVQCWLQRLLIQQLALNATQDAFLSLLQSLHLHNTQWTEELIVWIENQPARWLSVDNGKLSFFSACLFQLNGDRNRALSSLSHARELIPANTPFFFDACEQLQQSLSHH